jgi:hypothetical protein
MPVLRDKASRAITQGRDAATRAGKIARAAAIKAAKAGAEAAVLTGSEEIKKGWAESEPAVVRKRRRKKIAAVVAGAAAIAAVGVAVSRSKRSNGKAENDGAAGNSTSRLRKEVSRARKRVETH